MSLRNGTRRIVAFLALAPIALIAASPAGAETLAAPAQPLGIVTGTTKPACDSPSAPMERSDLAPQLGAIAYGYQDDGTPGLDELSYAALGFDLLPSVTLCDPASQAIPDPFGGTTAAAMPQSRVGRGWRELGATLAFPAPLVPGDEITVPEASDAAKLHVSVAPALGETAGTVDFTDLSPGPSRVTIARDQRGVVATLTRADGTTAEGTATLPLTPALNPSVSGTTKRWKVVTHHAPGTVVYMTTFYNVRDGIGVSAADGRTVTTLRPNGRTWSRTVEITVVAINRRAATYTASNCVLRLTKPRRPQRIVCEGAGLGSLLAVAARASHAAAPAPVVQGAGPAARPILASAARAARSVPLKANPVARTAAMTRLAPRGVVPLAADINGDGRPDFWTESTRGEFLGPPIAGTVLVSSPSGLTPHDVSMPQRLFVTSDDSMDSELSAVSDVTGDGIGELVVDIGDRQMLIPGSQAWTAGTAQIRVPDPVRLGAGDYLLMPSSSSPGAPYASLDDVTGDGRAELGATDDSWGWQSIASGSLVPGRPMQLSAIARSVPAPTLMTRLRAAEDMAPRFDPRGRVIAGQFVGLSWPKVARKRGQSGQVTVSVRDALGRDVHPPATATVRGNALLLDYDRRSGDALLLGVSPECASRKWRVRQSDDCEQTVTRVRADGSVRHVLELSDASGANTAAQTARFLPDGPDADGDVEIVLSVDGRSLDVVDSTSAGRVKERAFGQAESALLKRRAPQAGLRFYPVFMPDGTRRVFAMARANAQDWGGGGRPVELSW